jgi:hypothetical protein
VASSLDLFAYLAAFVTVILALAVSDWVQSLHRLVRARERVRWSSIAILAALVVFLAILEEFFGLWRIAGAERFTYFDLLLLVIPPIILSLAAMTVLPDEVPAGGIDLTQYYMDNRRILFLLLSLWVAGVFVRLADLLQVMTGSSASFLEVAMLFPWQTVPLLLLFALLAWSTNLRVQLMGLVAVFILVNGAMTYRDLKAGAAAATEASAAIR